MPRENVAFGLRARGMKKATATERSIQWLGRVGLADFAGARPFELSGGQAQRVALARALATEPRVLLLDEPLAALDVQTRREVRRDLRDHLASFDGMRLLVTHDPIDAYALADRGRDPRTRAHRADGNDRGGDRPPPLPVRRRTRRDQPRVGHRRARKL